MKKKIHFFLGYTLAICCLLYNCSIFDNEPPLIEVLNFTSGDTIHGFFVLTGTASDINGIKNIQYRIDSGEYLDVEGKDNWNILIDLTEPGIHFITIKASDYHENTSYLYIQMTLEYDL